MIDDFAPQGSSVDVARYHAAADRLFRAAGNHAGRGRLDSTAKLREPKPPRALILSTGEEIPRGPSIRARILILDIARESINEDDLTACQQDAADGLYAIAMAGFLQRFAGRYDAMRAAFAEKVKHYRSKALRNTVHARTPEILSSLQAGFDLYIEFCVAVGAIGATEGSHLIDLCWNALSEAAASQAKHQGEMEPAARFISLLRSVLSSGQAHLEARVGGEPEAASGACGWRGDKAGDLTPLGDCIGWLDGEDVYLEPGAALRRAHLAARESGDALSISESALRKCLNERGWLASVDKARETLTVRRTICGSLLPVLHLRRSAILPERLDDDAEETQ